MNLANTKMWFGKNKSLLLKMLCILFVLSVIFTTFLGSVNVKKYLIVTEDKATEVYTHSTSVKYILKEANIEPTENDVVDMENGIITVTRFFTVNFISGDKTKSVRIARCTVDEALDKANIKLSENVACDIPTDTVLTKDTNINISYTTVKKVTEQKTVNCTYTEKVDSSILIGTTKIQKTGTNGLSEVTYEVTCVNGKEVSKKEVSSKVLKPVVNGVKLIGTKTSSKVKPSANAIKKIVSSHTDYGKKGIKTSNDVKSISTLKPATPIQLNEKGIPVNAKSSKVVQATAYHESHGCTATGVKAQPGYIAVNPAIIPYGTKMYIVSADGKYIYGYAIAADTGGFIKSRPTNVDLNFSSEAECNAFGRRNVIIYFL